MEDEAKRERELAECSSPTELIQDLSPDMLKLYCLNSTSRNPITLANDSHVSFMISAVPGSPVNRVNFKFVQRVNLGKGCTVVERSFLPNYIPPEIPVSEDDLSSLPKLKCGDVVMFRGTLNGNKYRCLKIKDTFVVMRQGFKLCNQVKRFEYTTENCCDGGAGPIVTEAQVVRRLFTGDVFLRVDGTEVYQSFVLGVNKAFPFLLKTANIKITTARTKNTAKDIPVQGPEAPLCAEASAAVQEECAQITTAGTQPVPICTHTETLPQADSQAAGVTEAQTAPETDANVDAVITDTEGVHLLENARDVLLQSTQAGPCVPTLDDVTAVFGPVEESFDVYMTSVLESGMLMANNPCFLSRSLTVILKYCPFRCLRVVLNSSILLDS